MKRFIKNFFIAVGVLLGLCFFIATIAVVPLLSIYYENNNWAWLLLPIACFWIALGLTYMPIIIIRPER